MLPTCNVLCLVGAYSFAANLGNIFYMFRFIQSFVLPIDRLRNSKKKKKKKKNYFFSKSAWLVIAVLLYPVAATAAWLINGLFFYWHRKAPDSECGSMSTSIQLF